MEISTKITISLYMTSIFLIPLITAARNETHSNQDLTTSIQDMQRANYFTFVLLLNMVHDKIPNNTTFLMPSDRALSKASLPDNKVLEFILRHSIPSPLKFDDLQRFPTGTVVPTYEQDYMLRIVNRGRREFYLNRVQLNGIDICTAGSSFRCHGIYGVLNAREENQTIPVTCSKGNSTTDNTTIAVEPSSAPSSPNTVTLESWPPVDGPGNNVNSSDRVSCSQGFFTNIVIFMVLFMMEPRVL